MKRMGGVGGSDRESRFVLYLRDVLPEVGGDDAISGSLCRVLASFLSLLPNSVSHVSSAAAFSILKGAPSRSRCASKGIGGPKIISFLILVSPARTCQTRQATIKIWSLSYNKVEGLQAPSIFRPKGISIKSMKQNRRRIRQQDKIVQKPTKKTR